MRSGVIEAGCKPSSPPGSNAPDICGPLAGPMRSSMSVAAVTVVNSTIIASPARHDCPFQVAHPSIIGIPGGDHVSSVKKNGYKPWERKIKSSTGKVNIAAELETDMKREQKTEAAAPVHTSTYAPAVKKKASVTPAEALGAISLTFSPYRTL